VRYWLAGALIAVGIFGMLAGLMAGMTPVFMLAVGSLCFGLSMALKP
jgi:hypothetical protein